MAKSPRDIVVRFASDVSDFLRGTDKVSDALVDAAKDLDKLGDEGRDTERSLSRSFDSIETDLEGIGREGKESARDLARAYERAADSMKRDVKDASQETKARLGEAGREGGAELAQNLGEGISSGDLSGTLSGTLGGLAGSLGATGPVGLALTGLGAVAAAVWGKFAADAEAAKQAAESAFEQLLEGADKDARLRSSLETTFGTYEEGLTKIAEMSEATGIPIADIAEALASGGEPARKLAAELAKVAGATERTKKATGGRAGAAGAPVPEDVRLADELAGLVSKSADASERAARAEERRAAAISTASSTLSVMYRGAGYAAGGSVYNSQVGQVRTP